MFTAKKINASLACLVISASVVTYTPHARAATPATTPNVAVKVLELSYPAWAAVAVFAHSLWTYHNALPEDQRVRPNAYNWTELYEALKNVSAGVEVQTNLNIVRKNISGLYYDGLIGHAGTVGSVRDNEKKGITEIPALPSRGVYGFISDVTAPAVKVALVGRDVISFIVTIELAKRVYALGFDNVSKLVKEVASTSTSKMIGADGSIILTDINGKPFTVKVPEFKTGK